MFLTIIANWIINPPLATFLANTILPGHPEFVAGIILLGISPCTAMVMYWIMLARGDLGQGIVNTAINALLMVLLYAPLAAFYLGVSSIPVPWDLIALSGLFFIVIPVLTASISCWAVINHNGQEWFDEKYVPLWSKVSIIALLTTLIIMFSLEGEIIINNPLTVALIVVPLLLGYAIMVSLTYGISWLANWSYKSSICNMLIGSSNHFEVACCCNHASWHWFGRCASYCYLSVDGGSTNAFASKVWSEDETLLSPFQVLTERLSLFSRK